jgi:transcriptional regulator with XRE-family HTH domain
MPNNEEFAVRDALRNAMRKAWLRAGSPSTRQISGRAHLSHTTVAKALNGNIRSWASLCAIAAALGANPSDFEGLWAKRSGVDLDEPATLKPQAAQTAAILALADAIVRLADAITTRQPPATHGQ